VLLALSVGECQNYSDTREFFKACVKKSRLEIRPGRRIERERNIVFSGFQESGMMLNSRWLPLLYATLLLGLVATPARSVPPVDSRGLPTLAPLMEQVTPAVVNIAVRSVVQVPDNPLLRDPFFRRFFDLPERLPPRERISAGSGVIVDSANGYVLTNNHVIDRADEIVVRLKDRREYRAELVGRDPATDIAMLRIDAEGLTEIPLGDSDRLRVGDYVIAIGNPFGLGQTVTSGIVSALGRSGLNIEGYEDFIQTDASINPGNSGGALVNLAGELVGINTAIIGPAGGNVGIGFAVPSNMARAVMNQLVDYGQVQRGRLGVSIQDLTPELAEALGVATLSGAVISQIEPDSAAAAAGLQPGDVVTAIDGQVVRDSGDLRNRIGLIRAGTEIELTLLREGRELRLRTRVGAGTAEAAAGGELLAALDGAYFADHPGGDGVRVTEVEPRSRAARNGLRADDVIVAVNRRPVRDLSQFREQLRNVRRVLGLTVQRGDLGLFIVIQ
jgi:serine protease DegQ